jgi:catechol-2,3-dioxygenase
MFLCFKAAATQKGGKLPPHHGSGNIHYAFEVKKSDYEDWKKTFQQKGIPIEQEVDWNGNPSFYFRDPENNLGEIVTEGMWGF